MIDASNTVIAYGNRSWGGAAKALDYAMKKKRYIVDISDKDHYKILV